MIMITIPSRLQSAALTVSACLLLTGALVAQSGEVTTSHPTPDTPSFGSASDDIVEKLEASLAELTAVEERIAAEKQPLNEELAALESELASLKQQHEGIVGARQASALEVANLSTDVKDLEATSSYLSNQLSAYLREFEAQLHVTEVARYSGSIEAVRLASEDPDVAESDVFGMQSALFGATVEHALEALGGQVFEGTAVDPDGNVLQGAFALIGPSAVFRGLDGKFVGTAEQLINAPQPRILPFANPESAEAVRELIASGEGTFPLDPTLGNAHKVESTKESFLEHAKKGGAVMWPLSILAGLALLVAVWKWVSLTFLGGPSRREVQALLTAVEEGDEDAAVRKAQAMKGPLGRMLARGADHLREPRDLIEEVMYEKMLQSRLKLQGMLPFVAICAASAPLLGLLGTVIGIIETFKLITIYGAGDPQTLSGGISTALITTEFGLIVAIPALLVHAYLSRKARAVVARMESTALSFANAVGRSPLAKRHRNAETIVEVAAASPASAAARPDPQLLRSQVSEILQEVLGPLEDNESRQPSVSGRVVAGVHGS